MRILFDEIRRRLGLPKGTWFQFAPESGTSPTDLGPPEHLRAKSRPWVLAISVDPLDPIAYMHFRSTQNRPGSVGHRSHQSHFGKRCQETMNRDAFIDPRLFPIDADNLSGEHRLCIEPDETGLCERMPLGPWGGPGDA